ncbi:MAG: prepilin peptidase [Rhodoferax sp.]|nr:prepilin peptidase [Rhodoferax sp.]
MTFFEVPSDIAIASVLGLLVGSFLNVVIFRLPKMLERQWAREHQEWSGVEPATELATSAPFNLLVPRSQCPKCAAPVRWQHNIPVLSYLILRGRCSRCQATISPQYPLVELATAAIFGLCAARWGQTVTAGAWCVFAVGLLVLACIDWETTLLPDVLVLPLLWLGLIAANLQWTATPPSDALWGAIGGYLSLWSVYWAFKWATGKEGMGYGDFKLFACMGAWFGWQLLIPLILLSSIVGTVAGLALKLGGGLREGGYLPFGPFLAGAGFLCLAVTPESLRGGLGL